MSYKWPDLVVEGEDEGVGRGDAEDEVVPSHPLQVVAHPVTERVHNSPVVTDAEMPQHRYDS